MTNTKTTDAAHGNLAEALAAFQAQIPRVEKGKTAQVEGSQGKRGYSYEYADLAEIVQVAMPLLGGHGLAFTAQPTMVGDAFVLQYALVHGSGESLEGIYPLPDPISTKPQTLGSAITYARRYAFCAATGIAPGGDDDDAAEANEKPAAARKPRASKPKAEPAAEPVKAAGPWGAEILDANTIDELRAVHARVETAGELGMPFKDEQRQFVLGAVEMHGLSEPPLDVTVGQMIGAVRKAIESKPTPSEALNDLADEVEARHSGEGWETATIPGSES